MSEIMKHLNGAVKVLKISVLYPIDADNSILKKFLYSIWALFFISSFLITDIQCVMYLITREKIDLIADGMIIMNTAVYTVLFINFFIFYYKSANLVDLVHNINTFSDQNDCDIIEQITMSKVSILVDRLAYSWTVSVVSAGIFTGMLPLVSGDRNIMPISGWFPFDYTKSPNYELSYVWQMFCQTNLGFIYGASDIIYPCMVFLIAQQFKILGSNLKSGFYSAILETGAITKDRVADFYKNSQRKNLQALTVEYREIFAVINSYSFHKTNMDYLKKNIKHYQILLNYCEDLNDIMSPFLLTKVMSVTFVTILTTYCLITSGDRTLIFGLVCYVFFGVAELFVYNYSGQLFSENVNILDTLYKCPWYLCDLKFQKLLLMVQIRMSRDLYTRAGNYFTMSTATYISFIKFIYSYAAVLKEMARSGRS